MFRFLVLTLASLSFSLPSLATKSRRNIPEFCRTFFFDEESLISPAPQVRRGAHDPQNKTSFAHQTERLNGFYEFDKISGITAFLDDSGRVIATEEIVDGHEKAVEAQPGHSDWVRYQLAKGTFNNRMKAVRLRMMAAEYRAQQKKVHTEYERYAAVRAEIASTPIDEPLSTELLEKAIAELNVADVIAVKSWEEFAEKYARAMPVSNEEVEYKFIEVPIITGSRDKLIKKTLTEVTRLKLLSLKYGKPVRHEAILKAARDLFGERLPMAWTELGASKLDLRVRLRVKIEQGFRTLIRSMEDKLTVVTQGYELGEFGGVSENFTIPPQD